MNVPVNMRFPSLSLSTRNSYAALALFTLVLMVSLVLLDHFAPAGRRVAKVGGIDPPAYFGVSHALLFHHNFDLADEYRHVIPDESPWTSIRKETGHPGSAYAVGYSILAIPLLAAGTMVDALAGNPADGYSRFAMLGYCLTNVVLIGLGLIALFTFLHRAAEEVGPAFSPRRLSNPALFITAATFFGTTAGYYAFSQMSHAATFFCASLFLMWWWKVRDRTDIRGWLILGLLGGLLSISRWQDMFYLGGPLLFDLLGGLRGLGKRLPSRIVYAAAAGVCWVPQLLEWKYIFGKFFVIPQGSGFIVFPPQFVAQVLFSSQNGWFIWTPLTLLGFCGLAFGAFRMPRVYLPWMVVIALEVLLIGSLPTTWNGADSFSARYLTSSAPLIAFGVLTILCAAGRVWRPLLMAAVAVCCLFTVLFAIQFRLDLIPRNDRLTAAECFTDKLRLYAVYKQKVAVKQARDLLLHGSPEAAVATLEKAQAYGENREVLSTLSAAYHATGRDADARRSAGQLDRLVQARLW